MEYRVTISGGIILEKCIQTVCFQVDTPNDCSDRRTTPKNSMIITGNIDTDESTSILYKWALLPATNQECYKEITVEQYHSEQLLRKVCFSKAFVVDYSESYSNHSGTGIFTIYLRQFIGKEIECIGQTNQQTDIIGTDSISNSEEFTETAQEQEEVISSIQNVSNTGKSHMSITDRIAKQNEIKDNSNKEVNRVTPPSKADLDAYREELSVPDTNTVAVGKTDIAGLEDIVFKGGSPEVRNEAGLPSLDDIAPNREFKAPYDHAKNPKLGQFTRHAEEGVLNEFDDAIKKADIKPEDVSGNLYIHQSNPRGVCNKCTKGLLNDFPEDKCGIFYQASKKYPNLIIKVTSEIDDSVKANGLLSFVLKNGKILE